MKIAVVYWSGTGNTEAMAEAVAEGIKISGSEADLLNSITADDLGSYDAAAFGCPAMGAEELEDGEWMRTWEDRCKDDGAVLVCESVICNEAPDDEALNACKALGKALAN